MATTSHLHRWTDEHDVVRLLAAKVTALIDDNSTNGTVMSTLAPTTPIEEDDELIDIWKNNKWMLVTPRITAIISLLAIGCVAIEAWKDLQADKNKTNIVRSNRIRRSTTTSNNACVISRIQLFYQIPLFCYTLALALGTIPAPHGQDIWAAVGNTATCSLQGFLLQFGLHGCVGWDCVLSTTYLMMVRYRVANLRLTSFEKYYHAVIWTVASIMSILPLAKGMYNFNNTSCWLESFPDNCEGDECIRGEGAPLWQNLASLMVILHLAYSVTMMICLYCSIRGLENTKNRYSSTEIKASDVRTSSSVTTANTNASRRCSRAVGIQGILYASGMLITAAPMAFSIFLWNTVGVWNDNFGIFATTLVPLVGYVNFVVFMRGRTVESCHTPYAKWLRRAHRCLFDYNFVTTCQKCLPKREDCDAASSVPSKQSGPEKDQHGNKESAPQQQHDKSGEPSATSPMTSNHGGVKGAVRESEGGGTDGAWTGFMIRVKKRGQRFSQWVSELGASVASFDSEDDDSSFCDEAPVKPLRMLSGGIAVDKEEKAPAMPVRMLSGSTVLADEEYQQQPPTIPERLESCALDGSGEEGPWHGVSQHNTTATPPAMPERYLSEVEPELSFRRAPPSKPERLISEVEPELSFRRAPPSKPERLISEVEQEPSFRRAPPTKPERMESEVEPQLSFRRAPPTMPERMESEVEPQLSFRRAPPTKPERMESEVEPQLSFRRAPPSKPERMVSEFEREASFNQATPKIATRPRTSAPPTRPERYLSKVETPEKSNRSISFDRLETIMSENTRSEDCTVATRASTKKSLLRRLFRSLELPPSRPERYAGDVEAPPQQQSGTPPAPPARCASELEATEEPQQQSAAPPAMPARYVSGVNAPEPDFCGQSSYFRRYSSVKNKGVQEIARGCDNSFSEAPPNTPKRCSSKGALPELDSVEPPQPAVPPMMPARYESEVELPQQDDNMPPVMPKRYSSKETIPELHTSQFITSSAAAPPHIPIRFVSEIDMDESATSADSSVRRRSGNSINMNMDSSLDHSGQTLSSFNNVVGMSRVTSSQISLSIVDMVIEEEPTTIKRLKTT